MLYIQMKNKNLIAVVTGRKGTLISGLSAWRGVRLSDGSVAPLHSRSRCD
jgi:hypothetical protein